MRKIDQLRDKIDEIDEQVLKLFNRRASLAIKIGQEKSKVNKSNHFHVPHREREIIERLQNLNDGVLPSAAIERVFREVFSATLALEKPLTIAFLGPETTFSHQAAIKQFGRSADFLPQNNIDLIFSEVEKGDADYGVVPIENSIEGVINSTLDNFFDSPLMISDEVKLGITLNLMSKSGDPKKITAIHSHPNPLAQCRNWLGRNYPGIELVPASSTAHAAKLAGKDRKIGAIAGQLATESYSLKIISSQIEDQKENYTRFWVISKEKAKKAKRNKTSIMFSIKDESGSLLRTLELFAKHKINLTKIQSRPLRNRPWEYLFFVDFDGHREDKAINKVLEVLSGQCLFLKILGSYPRKV